jgi:trehalose/maltose hydrolase-like predicted phosphorylase
VIISQFEEYEKLIELDWDGYRMQCGNNQRLDLIPEADNDNTNGYKLAKQADVPMSSYVFSADQLRELFGRRAIPSNLIPSHETSLITIAVHRARTRRRGSTDPARVEGRGT